MTLRYSFLTCFAATLVTGGAQAAKSDEALNQLNDAERRGGWRLLFDGKSTKGWRNFKKESIGDGWVVKDGAIVRAKGGAGDIITVDQFENFELALEYRIAEGGNSGIMFHVTEDEDTPWKTGPEIQVLDNKEGHDPQKAGWLYQLYKPVVPSWVKRFEGQAGLKTSDVVDATRPAGQWNHIYLRIAPQQCEVALNGVSYFKFKKGTPDWDEKVAASKFSKFAKFGKATKGHICLQDHGDAVAYRNIKIRELPADGSVPDPVDGKMKLKGVAAFPNLKWQGWDGVDEKGRVRPLRPIVLTHAGDGSRRIFVAAQVGMIHVFDDKPDDDKETVLLLDLRSKVSDWKKGNEEGLLGLAFHPKYKRNRHFFVYYTSKEEPRTSIVSRFTTRSDDPNRADPDSEVVVMKIKQPFANHNGGSIEFGPDGYLYIGLGDGGSRNDPFSHGQNLQTWMGSILRIDVDNKSDGRNYAIPPDNPFVKRKGAKPEIFAYGFRNVWRLGFDRKTGDLWAADVGQDLWEEVNIVQRGGNYGWNIRESMHAFGNGKPTNPDKAIDPVWEYDHRVGKSITGGYVYRGTRLPELQGMYLYADYVSGKIWALEYDKASGKVIRNMSLAEGGLPVLAFGEDQNGEVYYMIGSASGNCIFRFEWIE